MKCIKCGKKTSKLIDDVCHSCYSKKSLIKNFKTLNLKYCNFCKKLIYKNREISDLEPIIFKHIIPEEHFVIEDIEFEINMDKSLLDLTVIGYFDFDKTKQIQESYNFDIKINQFMCNNCKKKSSQAYAAIIQLRNNRNKNYDKIENHIIIVINKDKSNNIVKTEDHKNGMDFYTTNIDAAMNIAKSITEKYGAEIKTSKKLYGVDKQTSKQVHRVTILIKLFDFSVDDIILYNDNLYKITKIIKNNLSIKNINTNKSKKISIKEDFKLINKDDLIELDIIAIKPYFKVLNQEYQEIELKSSKQHKINDKVKVLIYNNIAYEV